MIKNKVLVFFTDSIDINKGGPSGFIAHNLLDKPRDCFLLSQDLLPQPLRKNKLFRFKRFIYSITHKHIYLKKNYYKDFFYYKLYYNAIGAFKYKFIYFHSAVEFELCKELILPEQVVIFQPHSPECAYEEFQKKHPYDLDRIEFIKNSEKNAFERANIIVLPNEHCVNIYSEFLEGKNKQYKFIISGAKSSYADNNTLIKLDENSINLMYIGRRNEIKGFDIILRSFRRARRNRKDINLILVGSGNKIEEDGIFDIGFTNNPIQWYNSVDYLINSNRKSYFDLSILEALSTGVPLIMSDNYGHKYFHNKTSLIKTFDVNNKDALYEILIGDLKKRNRKNEENYILYMESLSDTKYFERLTSFFREIMYAK